jgi:hypothetical protein
VVLLPYTLLRRLQCGGEQSSRPYGTGEEPEVIPFLMALAIACVAFWRVAVKIIAIAAVFLLVSGIIQVIQYLHYIK